MQHNQVPLFSFRLSFFFSFVLIWTLATAQIIIISPPPPPPTTTPPPTNTSPPPTNTSPPPTNTPSPPTNTTSPPTNTTTPTTTITKAANITKPGCQKQCGNLTVPYPFGIGLGSGCAIDPNFEINCDTKTTGSPTPLLGNIKIYDISDAEMRISSVLNRRCYSSTGVLILDQPAWMTLGSSSPYSFSPLNRFTVVGCDEAAIIVGDDFVNGCPTVCTTSGDVIEGRCC